jgi:hypothetical protein
MHTSSFDDWIVIWWVEYFSTGQARKGKLLDLMIFNISQLLSPSLPRHSTNTTSHSLQLTS